MLRQNHKPIMGLVPVADAFAGTKSSARVNMKTIQSLNALIIKGVGTTGTSVVTVEKSSASDGTNAEAITFQYRRIQSNGTIGAWTAATTAGFTTTAGSSDMYEIAVDQNMEGLAEGDKPWCGIKMVESVDDPVVGAVVFIGDGGRYGMYS